ncbi:PPK2 family polyphosphate:nucleotide phosphotransferase [Sediminihabitans luteus]|uniref:PPK2 family polyphosphate:nucleotide phosphotransferase n=1 Tax=Sediminihabitans luteus TaxID=1138585 RepID=A0A2M9CQB3_9CELL|nr:PPK2 family polyphosphate kinase [Sediminihabitans luteus]PJJ74120.1 PPK2 family polyphosphate:nucleotide phosphotransferase [Sediminihabitans luteus]
MSTKSSKKSSKKKHSKKKSSSTEHPRFEVPPREALRADGVDLEHFDRGATPGWSHGKKAAEHELLRRGEELSELQERLFAEGRTGGSRSVLLVLQGMDTAGKGGIVRHVVGMVDPQGVDHSSFGAPTPEELAHDFLWRIRKELPRAGRLGVFDRSHYEDVLIAKVDALVPADVVEARYDEINAFEAELVAAGTTIVKVALFVSLDEQKARLGERLERPDKHWKFDPSDLAARARWPEYQEAYQAVLDHTSTDVAPWHVIPADHKWYARLTITQLLLDAFRDLDLGWPPATFDVEEQKRLLAQA